jgi:DNA-binding transcriptional LysR family regulator
MSPLATARSTRLAIACVTCAADEVDQQFEFLDLITVRLVPVVAPNFLRFPISGSSTSEQMRESVQCVIRGTARRSSPRDYDLIEGVRSWTANDQLMKRELILQGMGSGHLPHDLIEPNLRDAKLLPITGKYFQGGKSSLSQRVSQCATGPESPTGCGNYW